MSRPFLILQLRPEDEAAESEFSAFLRYGRLDHGDVERVRVERDGLPHVDLDRYAAIIVGGSPFDVSTPSSEKGDVQRSIEAGFDDLLEQVLDRDFPFLGACSGNGLLGAFCGAPISTQYGESVGGADVFLTEAGRSDPLLSGFPDRFRVLLGHKEACDEVPAGATLLVRGKTCPVQMFRIGGNVYATQFHPEGDPTGFELRIRLYKNHGYFRPDEAMSLIERVRREETPFAQEILRRFVERYRPVPSGTIQG